jgi:putative NADH-flavin reductase
MDFSFCHDAGIAILYAMKVTVLGASGKVGRRVVAKLLDEGHNVAAFIYRHPTLAAHPNLTLMRGDVHSSDDIMRALSGSSAVISALGSWHTPEKNILSSAMERLIPAMRAADIRRIVSVTGASAFAIPDHPRLFDTVQHALVNAAAPKVLRDAEEHMRLLADSGLDWTVVRSPVMNERGESTYQLGPQPPLPWQTIHREAVATCMVKLLEAPAYYGTTPFITRS